MGKIAPHNIWPFRTILQHAHSQAVILHTTPSMESGELASVTISLWWPCFSMNSRVAFSWGLQLDPQGLLLLALSTLGNDEPLQFLHLVFLVVSRVPYYDEGAFGLGSLLSCCLWG